MEKSQIPYFDSSTISGNLRYNYMPPIDALMVGMKHLGSTNPRALERYSNSAAANQAAAR